MTKDWDTKQDIAAEIREWVYKRNLHPRGTMETLKRMSARDLDTLVWAIRWMEDAAVAESMLKKEIAS